MCSAFPGIVHHVKHVYLNLASVCDQNGLLSTSVQPKAYEYHLAVSKYKLTINNNNFTTILFKKVILQLTDTCFSSISSPSFLLHLDMQNI